MGDELSRIRDLYQEADNTYSPKLHKSVEGVLLEDTRLEEKPPVYSELARAAVRSVVSDFRAISQLESGETFRKAVRNLRVLLPEDEKAEADEFADRQCSNLADALYGRLDDYPFPTTLTCMLDLKMLRPDVYQDSLNAAKWAELIAWADYSFNKKNDIPNDIDPRKVFIPSLLMNYGMIHQNMPKVAPKEKLSPDQKKIMDMHAQVGLAMLLQAGMPKSEYLVSIVGSHNLPLDGISAVPDVAERFEGMFFSREYREEKMAPEEVFRRLGIKLFGKKVLGEVEEHMKQYGHRYTEEQAKKNPLIPPFVMAKWLYSGMSPD